MVKAGYAASTSKRTNKVTRTKGWAELMEEELPDKLLAKRHRELLDSRQVEIVHNGKESHAEIIDQPDVQAVSKGLDMAYKLGGKYAPDKHLNVNVEVEAPPEIKELTKKLNAIYGGTSSSSDGGKPSTLGDQAQDKE